MKRTEKKGGLVRLEADEGMMLYRRDGDPYDAVPSVTVKAAMADDYAEIAAEDVPPFSKADYKAKTVELIRQRYDQDDENGILRQRDTKPEEFAEFNAYVEQCKARAKAELSV